MKGIVLAGGSGSRLFPLTKGLSKQLLPVYDKPMIYYPLSVLMLAGIKDILVITTPTDRSLYMNLLGDGSRFGVRLQYATQHQPDGLAQAFIIGENFIGSDDVTLILGDNIFWGQGLSDILHKAISRQSPTVFGYRVSDAKRFGVVSFDANQKVSSIEEKPEQPKSDVAVTGLYIYTNDVIQIAKSVRPSKRGELEITSVNQEYLKRDNLTVEVLGRGFAWLDTGTHESLLEAALFVETIQKRQSFKVACLEEIAWRNEWLGRDDLIEIGQEMQGSSYGQYLLELAENGVENG